MRSEFTHLALMCLAIAMLSFMSGCAHKDITDRDLTFVTTSEAQELVQPKRSFMGLGAPVVGVWLDARTEADYAAGHIPGAINLPYERVSKDHAMLREYDTLVVYGSDYNDNRADGMSKRLIELGYADVRTLIGGVRAWKNEGNPLETQ